ncbi:MAG TPA: hypothetical protein DDX71_03900 [Ruminococcus sp.]|nr:hypothetical protein [Ruminococcus sp.]
MTKEEILAKSRNENKGADLAELEIARRSRSIAGAAALLLGTVLNLIGTFYTDYRFHELWAIFFMYAGTQGAIDCIHSLKHGNRKRARGTGLYGVIMLIAAAASVVMFLSALKAGEI